MKNSVIIKTNEINIGSTLILKDNRKAIVKGFKNSMLPTISEIYEFETDIGKILPEQVKKIIK